MNVWCVCVRVEAESKYGYSTLQKKKRAKESIYGDRNEAFCIGGESQRGLNKKKKINEWYFVIDRFDNFRHSIPPPPLRWHNMRFRIMRAGPPVAAAAAIVCMISLPCLRTYWNCDLPRVTEGRSWCSSGDWLKLTDWFGFSDGVSGIKGPGLISSLLRVHHWVLGFLVLVLGRRKCSLQPDNPRPSRSKGINGGKKEITMKLGIKIKIGGGSILYSTICSARGRVGTYCSNSPRISCFLEIVIVHHGPSKIRGPITSICGLRFFFQSATHLGAALIIPHRPYALIVPRYSCIFELRCCGYPMGQQPIFVKRGFPPPSSDRGTQCYGNCNHTLRTRIIIIAVSFLYFLFFFHYIFLFFFLFYVSPWIYRAHIWRS